MTRARSRIFSVVVLMLTMGIAAPSWAGKLFYIFKDDKGRTRMHDTIPPEYAQKGYRVVNEQGATVEVVPPLAATPAPAKPQKVLSDQDHALLRTFQHVSDIAEARDRQIAALESIILSTNATVASFQRNLQELQKLANTMEEGGEVAPDKVRKDILWVEGQIKINKAFIEDKRKEQEDTRLKYDRDMQRFRELKVLGAR